MGYNVFVIIEICYSIYFISNKKAFVTAITKLGRKLLFRLTNIGVCDMKLEVNQKHKTKRLEFNIMP